MGTLADILAVPDLLLDPLVYKIDNETLAVRRPRGTNVESLVRSAVAPEETYALFAGSMLGEDESVSARLEVRLTATKALGLGRP